jgi:hypothetical protein
MYIGFGVFCYRCAFDSREGEKEVFSGLRSNCMLINLQPLKIGEVSNDDDDVY